MTDQLPPGQGPIDPRSAFSPPPPPRGGPGAPPGQPPGGWMPPQGPMRGNYPPNGGMPPGGPYPPMMMPPPYMYPPPRREKSFARTIFTTLATTIFGVSLLLNMYLLLFSGLMNAAGTNSNVIVEGDTQNRIAVIPIDGIIMDAAAERFARMADLAEKDSTVKAIIIAVDTPGGSTSASDAIYHRVRRLKEARNIPVVISMGGMATSGGYYVACAGDYIVAQQGTMTGNIGVLLPRYNISKLAEKWGIEDSTITSTGAIYKNAGSMFKPEDPKDNAYFQAIIDEAFKQFKAVVTNGRQAKLTDTVDNIANGKVYLGPEALKLGLVDKVGYTEDAYAKAEQLANGGAAGAKKMTIFRYQEPLSVLSKIFSDSQYSGGKLAASGTNVTINGVKIDSAGLRELMSPRLMYLWRAN